jgi:t-SNARE complex subunit (syntaxin)
MSPQTTLLQQTQNRAQQMQQLEVSGIEELTEVLNSILHPVLELFQRNLFDSNLDLKK